MYIKEDFGTCEGYFDEDDMYIAREISQNGSVGGRLL